MPATKTDPKPDLMFGRHSVRVRPHGYLIPWAAQKSTPHTCWRREPVRRIGLPRRVLQVGDVDPELFVSPCGSQVAAEQGTTVMVGRDSHTGVIDGASRDRKGGESLD